MPPDDNFLFALFHRYAPDQRATLMPPQPPAWQRTQHTRAGLIPPSGVVQASGPRAAVEEYLGDFVDSTARHWRAVNMETGESVEFEIQTAPTLVQVGA